MENYENLGTIGEGTYGIVLKCRHKETGQIVAIKKFKESDEDEQVRKTALREVRLLKQLKHDNIVNLIEVFRRKGKLYLVFEYVERTILQDLEKYQDGLESDMIKKIVFQLLKAIEFCHSHNVIHRDIKPENLLISKNGALKLCDFGFARTLAGPGAKYTDYVATRWYRAPELLVGDTEYSKPVDVWAIGCMFAEISNGLPLFPGESDIDQLYHIVKCFGRLSERQMEIFSRNPLFEGQSIPAVDEVVTLDDRFQDEFKSDALKLLKACLHSEPERRETSTALLNQEFFSGFDWFEDELRKILELDAQQFQMKRKRVKKEEKRPKTRERDSIVGSSNNAEVDSRSTTGLDSKPGSRHQKHRNKDPVPSLSMGSRHHFEEEDVEQSHPAQSSSNANTTQHHFTGFASSLIHNQEDEYHHLPNLRATTPRAARLVAFPQLTGESEHDNDFHVRTLKKRTTSQDSMMPSIHGHNQQVFRAQDSGMSGLPNLADLRKPYDNFRGQPGKLKPKVNYLGGKGYSPSTPKTPQYDRHSNHSMYFAPPRSPQYDSSSFHRNLAYGSPSGPVLRPPGTSYNYYGHYSVKYGKIY
eukprot:GFYU01004446.1.p1 GENE.GFYU01004446.1~~GFYU01004446.1.p1  ORF type:complete len:585 (-),score=66.64 GFYU01004446.1:590-2344(-)